MRIAIMGAGGIGGYYGAKLAQAGNTVSFIARGRHLDAMRTGGLTVRSQCGDIRLEKVDATDDPTDIGPVDVVLFMVKLYDVETAGLVCKPLLGPDTAVIAFQNGVSTIDVLEPILGGQHLLGGVANISATLDSPGVIQHHGQLQILRFGERDNQRTQRVAAFHQACIAAGIEAHILDDTEAALWIKFAFLAAVAGANCLTRQPIGPIRDNPESRGLLRRLVSETVMVGRAKGVALPVEQVDQTMATIDALPADMKASMLVGLERGERLESDGLNGSVARMGAALGVPAPTHATVADSMALFRDGR